jgi:cobalt-zinc-cadmium efflux system protein
MRERFGIGHTTLQVEIEGANACALAPDTVV